MIPRLSPARLCVASALVALAVFLPGPGGAQEPSELLIFGPEPAHKQTAQQAHDDAGKLLRAQGDDVETMHVSHVPFFAPMPLWVVGDAGVKACGGEPTKLGEIRTLVEEGKQSADELQDKRAAFKFREAWLALECAAEPVPHELLYEIHFYGGVAAFVAGREAVARTKFRAAVGVAPEREFDPRYPPELASLYATARQNLTGDRLELSLLDPHGEMEAAWLDGITAEMDGEALGLAPGDHLLQIRLNDGEFMSLKVAVEGEGQALVISRRFMESALLAPYGDPHREFVALKALQRLADRRQLKAIVGVDLSAGGKRYRYDVVKERLKLRAVRR